MVFPVLVLTAYCLDETTEQLKGHYTWSEIEATELQTQLCEFGGTVTEGGCDIIPANVNRQCNEFGRWEAPDVSNCISEVTNRLCSIREVRIELYVCSVSYAYTLESFVVDDIKLYTLHHFTTKCYRWELLMLMRL